MLRYSRQLLVFAGLGLALFASFYISTSYFKTQGLEDFTIGHKDRISVSIAEKITTRSHTTTSSVPKCNNGPQSNLLFLKTHKTGSTTLQNLLLRYAWANDLFVGLPLKSNNFGFGEKFSRNLMQPVPVNQTVNMLMHHMAFDHEQVASVLPSDAVYATILRDPATQFESTYKYFETVVSPFIRAKARGGFKEFLLHPRKYFQKGRRETFSWFAKNGMSHDLGFDNENESESYQHQIVQKMEEIFDLVMISEYFDISLLLLKDFLCWEMKDIAYLSANARNLSTVEQLSSNLKQKVYNWNKLDTRLYKHYNKTFWHRVANYGKTRLEKDLAELAKVKKEVAQYCVEDKLLSNKEVKDYGMKMYNPPGMDMTQYQLKEQAKNNETCRQLILPEIPWWKKMSNRQKVTAFSRRAKRRSLLLRSG